MPYIMLISGALTLDVSRGSRLDVPSMFPAPCHALGRSAGRLQKDRWDGSLFPIMPPVTYVLDGEASGAFNALTRVRASGSGRRPCARHPPIRVSPFRIRRYPALDARSIRSTLLPSSRLRPLMAAHT